MSYLRFVRCRCTINRISYASGFVMLYLLVVTFQDLNVHMAYFPFSYMTGRTVAASKIDIFKGLRPVLEGFAVPMHEGACETGGQIQRALGVHWDNKPRQIGLNHDNNMTFQFHPVNVSNLHVKDAYVLEARAVSRPPPPLVTSRGAP